MLRTQLKQNVGLRFDFPAANFADRFRLRRMRATARRRSDEFNDLPVTHGALKSKGVIVVQNHPRQ